MNILKRLREQAKNYDCSVCGANHAGSEIRLLGRHEAAWIVRVTCQRCDTVFKLFVYADRERASLAPMTSRPRAPSVRRSRSTMSSMRTSFSAVRWGRARTIWQGKGRRLARDLEGGEELVHHRMGVLRALARDDQRRARADRRTPRTSGSRPAPGSANVASHQMARPPPRCPHAPRGWRSNARGFVRRTSR